MRKILVIDDVRAFPFPATYARTISQALAKIYDKWDEVWFDHDLGFDPVYGDTIYPVIYDIEERIFYGRPPEFGLCVVHTANPVGQDMIVRALEKTYPIRVVDAGEEGAYMSREVVI